MTNGSNKGPKKKQKPAKGFFDGVKKGGGNFFGGILDGVTGVIEKPFEGAEKGGIGGFFKGIGTGLAGLVSKPITGIVDAVSTTTEGIKNQIKDEEVIQTRERRIRCFYGLESSIRNYSNSDAFFKELLTKQKDRNVYVIDSFRSATIVKFYTGNSQRHEYYGVKCYIGVSNKAIAILCYEIEMIIMQVNQITSSKPKDENVLIEWTDKHEKNQILIKLSGSRDATKLFNVVGSLQG